MDFIKSLKDGFTKTANRAMQVSNEVVEITKLNFAISDVQSDIDYRLKAIGQMVFESYTKNDSISEEIGVSCKEISEFYEKLEDLKTKLKILRKIKTCEQCGDGNPCENKYCKNCGAKLPTYEKSHTNEDENDDSL